MDLSRIWLLLYVTRCLLQIGRSCMDLLRTWLLQYITSCLLKMGRSRLDLLRSLILYNPFSCPYLSSALPHSLTATLLWGRRQIYWWYLCNLPHLLPRHRWCLCNLAHRLPLHRWYL